MPTYVHTAVPLGSVNHSRSIDTHNRYYCCRYEYYFIFYSVAILT